MSLTDRSIRQALVLTISIFLFALLPEYARALSCAPRLFTLAEAYEEADSIIVGIVTECLQETSSDPWASGGADCSFDNLEVLKESSPARDHRGVASSVACGLSLQVGNQYLLFLDSENRPMHFSAALTGERALTQLSRSYVRILQGFRDGEVLDLSEPWLFIENQGTCSLLHTIARHQIAFRRLKADAPKPPTQETTRETVNGKTIIRTTTGPVSSNSDAVVNVEIVVTGDIPDYPVDTQMLSVQFPERPPIPERKATLSVGDQSWSLYRTQTSFSFGGSHTNTLVTYQIGGEESERILSAMTKPVDVVVSAELVSEPNAKSEPSPEVSQPALRFGVLASKDENYLGPTLPNSASPEVRIESSAGGARSNRSTTPPEPVLRLESRSTQLPAAVESYMACYKGSDR